MTSYLTIDADDAKKLCGRLEFDASWDKAGNGYYDLNRQMKFGLSFDGGFIAYSYSSILSAMTARLTSEEDEAPVDDCATAIAKRTELLNDLTQALKDTETFVRLIASNPALIKGSVERASTDWDAETILKDKVLSNIKEALNDIIAAHLITHDKRINPILEYSNCVATIIESWQRKHKKDVGTFAYDRSEQLKSHLTLLTKGKHDHFVRSEIAKFVTREVRDKGDLRAYFVADEVMKLAGAFKKARKAATKAEKASVPSGA